MRSQMSLVCSFRLVFGVACVVALESLTPSHAPVLAGSTSAVPQVSSRYLSYEYWNLGAGMTVDYGASEILAQVYVGSDPNEDFPDVPEYCVQCDWVWDGDDGRYPEFLESFSSIPVEYKPTSVRMVSPLVWLVAGVDKRGCALIEQWAFNEPEVVDFTGSNGQWVGRRLAPAAVRSVSRRFYDASGVVPPIQCISSAVGLPGDRHVYVCSSEGNDVYRCSVTGGQSSAFVLAYSPSFLPPGEALVEEGKIGWFYNAERPVWHLERYEDGVGQFVLLQPKALVPSGEIPDESGVNVKLVDSDGNGGFEGVETVFVPLED